MEKSSKRIGEILVELGFITEAQLHDALVEQKLGDKFLGSILVEKGAISSMSLAQALARQFNMQVIDIKARHLDLELARKFSTALVIDHFCFPIEEDDMAYTVAIINPLDMVALSKLEEEASPKSVNLVIAPEDDMREVLKSYKQYISQSIQRMLWKNKPPAGGIGGN